MTTGTNSLSLIVMLSSLLCCLSCNRNATKGQAEVVVKADRFGKQYNAVRVQMHIPIIEEAWVLHWQDSSYMYYSNEQNRVYATDPIHLTKTVYFRDKIRVSEKDIFHYEWTGDLAFKLETRIDFEKGDSTSFQLIKYFRDGRYPPTKSVALGKDQADSVFRAWGFDRFYSR